MLNRTIQKLICRWQLCFCPLFPGGFAKTPPAPHSFSLFFIFRFCCFLLLYNLPALPAASQDVIYFTKGFTQCKVTGITAAGVSYIPSSGKKSSMQVKNDAAVLLFNHNGNFLIPSKLDFSNGTTAAIIEHFLSAGNTMQRKVDEIYTISESRVDGDISKEDNKFVYLSGEQASKIDKRRIVAIIYKNGLHALLNTVPPQKAAGILWANRPEDGRKAAFEKTAKADVPDSVPEIRPAPPAKDTAATDAAGKASPNGAASLFEELSGNVSQEEFSEQAVKKTKQLNSYLKILCTKTYGYEEHNKALDQAIRLFINEDATVQVSSVTNDEIKSYKIRQYLLRLKSLNYDRVEVEWTNVQYIDKLKKGVDGNYYGTVTLEQVFRGFRDGKVVYEDVTKKSATVVLKAYEKSRDGTTAKMWDVMLSDIGVVYTKAQAPTS